MVPSSGHEAGEVDSPGFRVARPLAMPQHDYHSSHGASARERQPWPDRRRVHRASRSAGACRSRAGRLAGTGPLLPPAREGVGRGAADRQRPTGRHGLRGSARRAHPAERGHVLVRRAVRRDQRRGAPVPAAGAAAPARGPLQGGAGPGRPRSSWDGHATCRPISLSATCGSSWKVTSSRPTIDRELDLDRAVVRVRYRIGSHDLHARGLLERAGSVDRRASHRRRPDEAPLVVTLDSKHPFAVRPLPPHGLLMTGRWRGDLDEARRPSQALPRPAGPLVRRGAGVRGPDRGRGERRPSGGRREGTARRGRRGP